MLLRNVIAVRVDGCGWTDFKNWDDGCLKIIYEGLAGVVLVKLFFVRLKKLHYSNCILIMRTRSKSYRILESSC